MGLDIRLFQTKAGTITDYWLNAKCSITARQPSVSKLYNKVTIYQVRQASLSATSVIYSLRGCCRTDLVPRAHSAACLRRTNDKIDGWMEIRSIFILTNFEDQNTEKIRVIGQRVRVIQVNYSQSCLSWSVAARLGPPTVLLFLCRW